MEEVGEKRLPGLSWVLQVASWKNLMFPAANGSETNHLQLKLSQGTCNQHHDVAFSPAKDTAVLENAFSFFWMGVAHQRGEAHIDHGREPQSCLKTLEK